MRRIIKDMKDISLSFKGFISSPSLVVFIMIVSVLSGFNTCLRYKLEIMDNINVLSEKILTETKIINYFKCLMVNDSLSDFMIDDMYVEIIADGDVYNLFYNDNRIQLVIDEYRILSVEYEWKLLFISYIFEK